MHLKHIYVNTSMNISINMIVEMCKYISKLFHYSKIMIIARHFQFHLLHFPSLQDHHVSHFSPFSCVKGPLLCFFNPPCPCFASLSYPIVHAPSNMILSILFLICALNVQPVLIVPMIEPQSYILLMHLLVQNKSIGWDRHCT